MDWAILTSLGDADRRGVLQAARRRHYRKGAALFWEGDPGDCVHLVERGHVGIQVTTRRGDVATVRIVGPGEHFGELALVSAAPRSATATALDPVETMSIHRDHFRLLRSQHPNVSQVLVEALADEIRRLAAALTDALYLDAHDHLWRRLDDLVVAFTGADDTTVRIPLTQSELATLAGVTRQTAHGFLHDAADRGVVGIDQKGSITILDRAAIRRLAGRAD